MTPDAPKLPNGQEKPVLVTSLFVLVTHLSWFIIGPLLLVLFLWGIVQAGSGWITSLDCAFFAVVVLMIVGRWLDQRSGQGTTSTGELSTWNDFRRYVAIVPVVAIVAWIVANVTGNHFMEGGELITEGGK